MFHRTAGYLIVPAWLAAMSWLFAHDVLPGLTAGDPPAVVVSEWLRREGKQSQYVIRDDANRTLGWVWTTYSADELAVQRKDVFWLEDFPLPVAPLRLQVDSTFSADGALDEFTATLSNAAASFKLHGERFHSVFSFTLNGKVPGRKLGGSAFKVPLVDGASLGAAFKPFGTLDGLHVGQAWRMQVFNPLAALLGVGDRFIPMLVRVVGEETIWTAEGPTHCFLVESSNARAWVDAAGVVHMQEVELPVAGKLRILREVTFDESRFARARDFPFEPNRTRRP